MSVPDVLAVTWADLLCLCELPGGGARELQPASLRGQGCDREAESAPLSARSCRSLPGLRSLCPRLSAGLDREGSLSRLHVGPRGVALGLHPRRQIWGSGCQRSPELWRVAGPGWSCASPEWAASCLGLQLSQAWRGPRGPRTSVQHTAHTASSRAGPFLDRQPICSCSSHCVGGGRWGEARGQVWSKQHCPQLLPVVRAGLRSPVRRVGSCCERARGRSRLSSWI